MDKGNLDILVGGQFGDEGKGQVCVHLAMKNRYSFYCRVGGSQAEHRSCLPNTQASKQFTSRVIPTGAWVSPEADWVLGAGHIIKETTIKSEILSLYSYWGSDTVKRRLKIDRNATVITNKALANAESGAHRGTTHQGNGYAAAQKVLRNGDVLMAKDCDTLKPYITDTVDSMNAWLDRGYDGFLEGSQGVLLSLNHGYYPFCTSKDVTPAAILAESGLTLDRVRDIWSVFRTFPMRVPGNSGPSLGKELSWAEVETLIGHTLDKTLKKQTETYELDDSPEHFERIFQWNWEEFTRSIMLTRPTKMALTFLDWIPDAGYQFKHIHHMERMANAPVSLVRFGRKFEDSAWLGEGPDE